MRAFEGKTWLRTLYMAQREEGCISRESRWKLGPRIVETQSSNLNLPHTWTPKKGQWPYPKRQWNLLHRSLLPACTDKFSKIQICLLRNLKPAEEDSIFGNNASSWPGSRHSKVSLSGKSCMRFPVFTDNFCVCNSQLYWRNSALWRMFFSLVFATYTLPSWPLSTVDI